MNNVSPRHEKKTLTAENKHMALICVILLLGTLRPLPCFGCSFTVSNNCPHEIWPATLAGAGTRQLETTGFRLNPGESARVTANPGWSGRIWARTGCTFDDQGTGSCETGDCGGKLECAGAASSPPATLFEITLGVGSGKDFYDVSLVDGYNLPVSVFPHSDVCNATGCISDLNLECPPELKVVGSDGAVVACRSACEKFGLDEYCCSGEYGNPTACRPSAYAAVFKNVCPKAYSYAFDDFTSTFTCVAPEYDVTFCPSPTSFKASVGGLGGREMASPSTSQSSSKTPALLAGYLLFSTLIFMIR